MLRGARSLHMQAERQRAQHNGRDETDPNDAQLNAAEEEAFLVSITSDNGFRATFQVHSRMTIMELKELYQVCSYAYEAAMCMRMRLTTELYLKLRPDKTSNYCL
jgi:hypothetical protein